MSYEDNVKRRRIAEDLKNQVSASTPIDELREMAERAHGKPCSYTPGYHVMDREAMKAIRFELEDALIDLY